MDNALVAPVTLHRLFAIGHGCRGNLMDNGALVARTREAVERGGLLVVSDVVHTFVPHGLTVALVLAQSHVVLSTWPELQVATADIAACAEAGSTRLVWASLVEYLRPERETTVTESIVLGPPTARTGLIFHDRVGSVSLQQHRSHPIIE
ncbi:MAG: S-adenosylmethionine decarboxylase [Micromonosporaceae bacterium]|nr:S-adenosylmethionine decarboxylase [Micromonosporaceae bacterium]